MIHTAVAEDFFKRVNPYLWDQDYDRSLKDILVYLPTFTSQGPWLAGGALRRMVTNQSLVDGDFDIFCQNEAQLKEVKKELEKKHAKIIDEKDHVVNYEASSLDRQKYNIQLIKLKYYPDAKTLIEDFDFTACMAAFDGYTIHYDQWFLYDNARMRLAVNKINYPVAALRRLVKYTNQGYYACNGCLQEIANAVHSMSPEDFKENRVLYVD